MNVELPLPRALALLGLALPAVLLTGRDIACGLTPQRSLRAPLTPVLALALWLVSVHTAGLLTHSFIRGLTVGTLGVALADPAVRLARRAAPARHGGSMGRGAGPLALLVIALVTLPIIRMAFGWGFHDEDLITGHLSIGAQIDNDIYPPRHLTFASVPLHYHYGFDLLTACVAAIARTRIDVAIDVATVALWSAAAWLLWALGDLWFGRGRGWLTLALTLFAGGLPVCFNGKRLVVTELVGRCQVDEFPQLAPVVSSFFQHPWGLGVPLSLATILVFSARAHERPLPRLCALSLLLTALSLGQVVLFMTLLPSVVAAELWYLLVIARRPLRDGLGIVAAAGAAVTAAVVLGSSFTTLGAGSLTTRVHFGLGVVDGLSGALRWHVQSYALALPLALVGVWLLPRSARVLTALLVGGCLLVLNTFRYASSSDMVKFGVVAAIGMGLAGAAGIDRILRRMRGKSMPVRVGLAGLAATLMLGATSGGVSFALFFFWEGATRYYVPKIPPLPSDDARAASFLRTKIRAGEIVYRRESSAVGYARWAGLPIPWSDWAVPAFGFPQERIDARADLMRRLPETTEEYLAEGIEWFVLDGLDRRLNAHADHWIAAGSAARVATFGSLRVVKLGAPP